MEKLHKLYKDGKLVRLLRPVHFCSACNSSLAEAEVEHNAKESPSLTVKFPIGGKTYLLVWTTTPYTLFFNKAVAYNPKFTYVMWQEGDEYFVTLKEMAESLGKEYTIFNMDKITNDYPVVSPITMIFAFISC
jgi:isoleucyl-tRNA synthetase